jgi:LPS-assembly lipoprotein|tara:strand:+ start:258 stop:797 length:540 start_codon:yes stop_codon:yes gene_type:complete
MSFFRSFVVLVSLALVGACGFRPIYGVGQADGISSTLATVQIHPIADRTGQLLHNHLLNLLNPRGRPKAPRYQLHIRLKKSTSKLAVQKSAFATRANFNLSANMRLYVIHDGKIELNRPIFDESTHTISSYNVMNSEFATVMTEKDARSRAVRQIAHDIQTRLSLLFLQMKAAAQKTGK